MLSWKSSARQARIETDVVATEMFVFRNENSLSGTYLPYTVKVSIAVESRTQKKSRSTDSQGKNKNFARRREIKSQVAEE